MGLLLIWFVSFVAGLIVGALLTIRFLPNDSANGEQSTVDSLTEKLKRSNDAQEKAINNQKENR